MRTRSISFALVAALVAAAPTPSASAAVVIPSGLESRWLAGPTITLPDVNAADVAVAGASIFVGQGAFGAGQQSILRIDQNGSATTVVSNLNALGGIAYDVEGDRLLFTDNGGDLVGATTGDTVYALSNPRAVAAPVNAATLTLLADGSIPFAQAVLPLAGGDVLIGDAAGPGSGRVVKLSGGVPTNFITGLDYTAGISFAPAAPPSFPSAQIFVGNVDGSFVPSVSRYSIAGTLIGPVNGAPMSGALDQASDAGGNALVTGGFTDDFSSSTVTLVVRAGAVETIAEGLGFSSGITVDQPSSQILVLDFGLARIESIIDVPRLTPGGTGKKECNVETWGATYDRSRSGKVLSRWSCTDGDPSCDRDLTTNGSCDFAVGTCLRVQDDLRLTKCDPVDVDAVSISSKQLPTAASALQAAANAIVPATAATCSATRIVSLPADRKTRVIAFDASAGGKRLDKDTLKLRCLPQS